MKNSYTVIGLGFFGSAMALELMRLGHEVLGIDLNPALVNAVADDLTHAVVADARDENVLRDLGVHECDAVVVSIGEDLEANILATLIVAGMNKPKVWAKASNHNHHRILQKLGADHIVHPEHEMGERLAQAVVFPEVRDYINLGDNYFLIEAHISKKQENTSLENLSVMIKKYKVQLLAVKRKKEIIMRSELDENWKYKIDDQLLLLGESDKVRKLSELL